MKQNAKLTVFLRKKTLKVKKILTIFVLLLTISMQVSASVSMQKNVITIKEKNISLADLIFKIGEEMDAKFIFNYDDLNEFTNLSVNKTGTVEEILNYLLKDRGLTYKVNKDSYVIRKAEKKAVKKSTSEQDKVKLSGTVTDEKGELLPYVNVMVKGTKYGCITDINGRYELNYTKQENGVLIVTFIGYSKQYLEIGDQEVINVVLKESNHNLGEIVVTGIQTIEKGRATGSYSIVDEKSMDKIVSPDFKEKLLGTTPGLYVGNDNEILIRGISTLNASTSPLIVVDGIPLESSDLSNDNSFLNLNPNDIAQVSVLKDAASAAIWGVRAANGVIVITTKRGKKGETKVTYSGIYSIEEKKNFKDLHLMSTKDRVMNEFNKYEYTNFSPRRGSGYNEVAAIYLDYKADNIDLTEANNRLEKLASFNAFDQIEKHLFQSSIRQQHNITVQSGWRKTNQYLSLNFDHLKGELVGDKSQRFNLTSNTDFNISRKLKVGLSVRAKYQDNQMNGVSASNLLPYQRILDEKGEYVTRNESMSPDRMERYMELGFRDWTHNPLREMRNNDNTGKDLNLNTGLNIQYEIIEGLKFTTQANFDIGYQKTRRFYSKSHYLNRDLFNNATEVLTDRAGNPSSIVGHHLPKNGGILDSKTNDSYSYVWRNKLEYHKAFGDFRLRGLVGTEVYNRKVKNFSNRVFGHDPQTLTFQEIDRKSILAERLKGYNGRAFFIDGLIPEMSEILYRSFSYFTTASVTFKNRYDLFASARMDKTNLLVKSKKYRNNPSWSIGSKWDISSEDFFKSNMIDRLSLKVSYGLTGNMSKDVGPNITGQVVKDHAFPDLFMMGIVNPENQQLGWEKTSTINIGIDAIAFNNKLLAGLEFYQKNTSDVLAFFESDPTTGWNQIKANTAEILNRGVELNLRGTVLDRALKIKLGLNFAYNYNNVVSLNINQNYVDIIKGKPLENRPVDYVAAIRHGGLNDEGELQIIKGSTSEVVPWQNLSQFGINDFAFMGRKNPPVFGSFNIDAEYKKFRFDALFTYKFGHKVRMPSPDFQNWNKQVIHNFYTRSDFWQKAGDEKTKMLPVIPETRRREAPDRKYAVNKSDHLVDKGDIIRLKSVSLSYDFSDVFKKSLFQNAVLKFTAQNLGFWAANRYNLDSDYINTITTQTNYSGALRRKYIVSLNLNF